MLNTMAQLYQNYCRKLFRRYLYDKAPASKVAKFRKFLAIALILVATTASMATICYSQNNSAGQISNAQTQSTSITVNNQPLIGPFSLPQYRSDRLFLPIASIARALGDTIKIDIKTRLVEIRRQTGVIADFNAQLNQVRENGAVVLVVSNTAEINFSVPTEELVLPIEIISPLLDVAITFDKDTHSVNITRGQAPVTTVHNSTPRGLIELYQLDYTYNLNLASEAYNQNLLVNASGRIGSDQFDLLTNFSGGTGDSPLTFQRGTFTYSRANGQRFIAGDFGTGIDLKFSAATLRGLLVQQPISNFRITAFAGRAISNLPLLLSSPRTARSPGFNTTVLGIYATFGAGSSVSKPSPYVISTGVLYFDGPKRSGELVTASFKSITKQNLFQGDLAVGKFAGTEQFGRQVNGLGWAVDLAETFKLSDKISLQGLYTRISPNFLSPEAGGFLRPMELIASGIAVRPFAGLSASFSAKYSRRLDGLKQDIPTATATINISPPHTGLTILLTHTQANDSQIGSSANTLLNITKKFTDFRLFGTFSRLNILGQTNITGLAGASIDFNPTNSLDFSQSFSNTGSRSSNIDYLNSALFSERISIGGGFGYTASAMKLSFTERFLATLHLPLEQTLQLTYFHNQEGSQLLMQLRGPLLFKHKRKGIDLGVGDITSLGSIYGRVYQDLNLNGQFDPGIDQPQADVKLQVDGKYFAVTNPKGEYRIDNLPDGEHSAMLDLLTVRADLTILDTAQKAITLSNKRDLIVDFRLIRTGRITGLVWHDLDDNGKFDKDEPPLAFVRILASNGKDTQTDAEGRFTLGDLPPGTYLLLIDEKTLPPNTKSKVASLPVNVQAGSETSNINFPIITPVKVKTFSTNALPAPTNKAEKATISTAETELTNNSSVNKVELPAKAPIIEPAITIEKPSIVADRLTTTKVPSILATPNPTILSVVPSTRPESSVLTLPLSIKSPSTLRTGKYTLQLSASLNPETALRLQKRLQALGLDVYIVRTNLGSKGIWYRVRSGHFQNASEAENSAKAFKMHGLTYFITNDSANSNESE